MTRLLECTNGLAAVRMSNEYRGEVQQNLACAGAQRAGSLPRCSRNAAM